MRRRVRVDRLRRTDATPLRDQRLAEAPRRSPGRDRAARGRCRARRSPADAARDTVDGARKHVANPDGRDRIDRAQSCWRLASTASAISAAARNASCRSGISTAPAWPPWPFDEQPQARRRRNRGDDADVVTVALEHRSLLDVQFDEARRSISMQTHFAERAAEPGRLPHVVERPAVGVAEALVRHQGRANPDIRREPRQPSPKRVGSSDVNIRTSIERRG